jgi:Ribbon-Helix-Helix transcriptional regulator family
VQEGFYSNRADFIRTAIRNQLERHADVVKQSTVRKSLDLGLRNYSREDLEAAQRAGEMLHINVLGLATIAQDVTPDLARATMAIATPRCIPTTATGLSSCPPKRRVRQRRCFADASPTAMPSLAN